MLPLFRNMKIAFSLYFSVNTCTWMTIPIIWARLMTKVLLTYLKEYICTTLEFNFLQKLRLDIAVLRSVHWEVQSVSDQGPLSLIFLPFFLVWVKRLHVLPFFVFPFSYYNLLRTKLNKGMKFRMYDQFHKKQWLKINDVFTKHMVRRSCFCDNTHRSLCHKNRLRMSSIFSSC